MVRPLAKVLSLCVQYVDVILPLALPGLLTYAVPPEHAGRVRVGSRVVSPPGKRLHTAVVRAIHGQAPGHRTEAFVSLLDAEPFSPRRRCGSGLDVGALLLLSGRGGPCRPTGGDAARE